MAFTGFTKETIRLFEEIEENNSRDYFREHRQEYEDYIRKPLNALYGDLAEEMGTIDSNMDFVPGRCISTPYADQRFCGDRPLKEYMYLRFRPAALGGENLPGFFFDSGTDGVRYGFRIYHLTSKGMEAVRQEFCRNEPDAQRLIRELLKKKRAELHGRAYQRDHYKETAEPLKGWLNRKEWEVYFEQEITDSYFDGRLAQDIKEVWRDLTPLYRMIKKGLSDRR